MNRHDKIIASVLASLSSLSFEGLKPSDYALSLIEQYADGKITAEEFINKIKEKYNISK